MPIFNAHAANNCTGATYYDADSDTCIACPTGYDYNTTAGKTDISECQIHCDAGTWNPDYTQLEYIESDGSSYIDTGFQPDADGYKHTIVFEATSSPQGYVCGTGATNGRSGNVRVSNYAIDGIYNGTSSAVSILTATTPILKAPNTLVLDLKNNAVCSAVLNGTTISNSSTTTVTSASKLTLFGSAGASSATFRIYSDTIEKNGEIIHNFIPVKRNSDNEYGMFDTVTGQFFTNSGTGSFTAGPDVGGCFDVGVGYYAPASTVNYGSFGTRTACPAGTYNDTTNATSAAACLPCTGATYNDKVAQSACKVCPSGYTANTTAGKTDITECQIHCNAGTYVANVPDVPYGYTQLEYVGTRNNAYIISDLKVNDFDRVTARVTLYDGNITYPELFGASASTSAGADNSKVFRLSNSANKTIIAAYGNKWSHSGWVNSSTGSTFPLNTPTDIDVKLADGEQYIKINGNTIASDTLSATLNNPYNVYIFNLNYANAGQSSYSSHIPNLDCERITFYSGNNVVRDFVPARRNSDNEIGLYDTVTKQFFTNSGTGSFTGGSDVDGDCTDVGVGYYAGASTVNCGSTGTRTACPAGTTTSITNATSVSDCGTCNNDEISVYTNNGATLTCIPAKFTVTTTDLDINTNTQFKFNISARGTFYVDCGADGTLSGTGAVDNTITRGNVTNALYTCTYTTGGVKTIKFAGIATAYSTGTTTAAINFYTNATPTLVGGISGSLGAIFPTLGSASGQQPRFYQTFRGCTKITSIPSELFTGLSGTPASNMFQQTFYGCSGLTGSIPSGLFGNVSGSPRNASGLFASTFYNCSGLTGSIPENLFSKISGAPGNGTFNSTFYGCSKLSGSIPEDLFAGISGATNANTFPMTFYNCKGLTGSIPAGLFRNISGAPKTTMFYATFAGCSGLTGSIPEDLFAGISGAPANGAFRETFNGCSGLTGSIPEDLFAGVSGAPADSMFYATFSGCSKLSGSIPTGLFGNISGAPAGNMFRGTFSGCSNLSGPIPTGLFGSLSGAPAGSMFYATFSGCSKLTGSIPDGLFGNLSGAPANYMFYATFSGCSKLTGSIPDGLFGNLSGAPATYMFQDTFNGCSGLSGSIPSGLFGDLSGAPKVGMFYQTFYNCSNLTGPIPDGLFGNISGASVTNMFQSTFYNCRGLSGYIPKDLFENITSNSASNCFSSTFASTNLYTTCPCGTKPATTGWGATKVDSRAVCEVGTKTNEHWDNGTCTTDCTLGVTRFKSSTGLDYPLLSDPTGVHNIYFGYNNGVCHVPLVSGAANNAINVSFNGETYHASQPDEIMPTGFTGQPAPVSE